MRKIEQLSEIFDTKSEVVIFCSDEDVSTIFNEIRQNTSEGNYGTFKPKNTTKFNPKSVCTDGKTFHFISRNKLEKIFKVIEILEIG